MGRMLSVIIPESVVKATSGLTQGPLRIVSGGVTAGHRSSMRWVKATLVSAISGVLAYTAYGVTDNVAVPTAIVLSGLVFACMALALDGSGQAPRTERPRFPPNAESRPLPAGRPDPDAEVWRTADRRRVAGTR